MSTVIVISASYDKQIRLWDVASGRTLKSFTFQDSQINSLFLLPETGYLAVAGFGVLRLYDLGAYLHGSPAAGTGGAGGTAAATATGTGAAAAGGGAGGQVPPIYSSFESQGLMNFTSLGAVPLLRNSDGKSSIFSGSSRQLTDSASFVAQNDQFGGTAVMSDLGGILGDPNREISSLLIATSEDGHIRFFDSNSPVSLRMLKDIATGAAITCSAVSPDHRYLITGNQMGQVSVWHLPSIVASVAMEWKRGAAEGRPSSAHHSSQPAEGKLTKAEDGAVLTAEDNAGDALGSTATPTAAGVGTADDEVQPSAAVEDEVKAFGSFPLQDIYFANDYSAIRSIAIEPMARWAAVATSAGNVHFIRLAREASVGGSKVPLVESPRPIMGDGDEMEGGNGGSVALPQAGGTSPSQTSLCGSPQQSLQKGTARESVAGSSSCATSSRLPLTGRPLSPSEVTNSFAANYHYPRETIYRSALVVNELSANAHRASESSVEAMPSQGDQSTSLSPQGLNSMGAVLLDNLEQRQQQQNSMGSNSNMCSGYLHAATTKMSVNQSNARRIAEELEMEIFDTIQAHYKYILKVLVSPNGELLTTCCADYSVGRFAVPPLLRPPVPQGMPTVVETTTSEIAVDAIRSLTDATGPSADEVPGDAKSSTTVAFRSLSVDGAKTSTVPTPARSGSTVAEASKREEKVDGDRTSGATLPPVLDSTAKGDAEMGSINTPPPSLGGHESHGPETSFSALHEFRPMKPLSGHQRWVWDGVFSDCSRYLFTASSDNTLRMWNGLTTDRPQSVGFVGHTKPVIAVLLCYDKRRIST